MKVNIAQIGGAVQRLLGETARRLGRETGFEERDTELNSRRYLQTWVLGVVRHPAVSYNLLAQVAEDVGVTVSPQAIGARVNTKAVTFFQRMLQEALAVVPLPSGFPPGWWQRFTAIEVVDSSRIALPEALAEEFPASGGDGPKAGLKLQVVWQLLQGTFSTIELEAARLNDYHYERHLAYLTAGALLLCDLGYFTLDHLAEVVDKLAYFITRFSGQSGLLHPLTGAKLDVLADLRHQAAEVQQVERDVHLGCRHHIACRLIAVRLPAEQVARKRRRAQEQARTHKRRLKDDGWACLGWSVFLTNVPADRLSAAQVLQFYRLRWQIELLFKLWKSYAQLDHLAQALRPRILCELYAKLIALVLFQALTAPVRADPSGSFELSPIKAWQTFQHQAQHLTQALASPPAWLAALRTLYDHWCKFAAKDKRKTRLSSFQQLLCPIPPADSG